MEITQRQFKQLYKDTEDMYTEDDLKNALEKIDIVIKEETSLDKFNAYFNKHSGTFAIKQDDEIFEKFYYLAKKAVKDVRDIRDNINRIIIQLTKKHRQEKHILNEQLKESCKKSIQYDRFITFHSIINSRSITAPFSIQELKNLLYTNFNIVIGEQDD